MRAVRCREFGPPEALSIEEVPDPVPGPGQLVIDVRATAVTFPDALMIEDQYQGSVELPYTPGGEAAGVVREIGAGVEAFRVGDFVVAGGSGGFAEQLLAEVRNVRAIPPGVEFAEATGLLYSHGTAYYGLKHRGALQPGESLLVLGGGGNVGLAAVEVGKLLGARVIAAASTPEKLALCRERGADELIDYSQEDLKVRAKELTGGRGADVVYDPVGGEYAEQALRATAWQGRYLVIGFTAGIPSVPLNLPLLKGCQVIGVFFGRAMAQQREALDEIMDTLLAHAAKGELRPVVSHRYSLDEAPQALADLKGRRVVGRVVVEP
ncbi:MAG: NADPH:quinone oxidoreductase family protein [Deltaproteobacteria bacterium]|nr:NADPH:quinone oxidoreductase family protein [Deltaproteobacteria bacterium]MBW2363228.1 NADPH:quinone oxidoreductase family protein [Deltaproteobacteria bacterium]